MIDKLIKEVRDVKLEVNSRLSKNKNYTCHYPECDEKAILSHSFSKNTLYLISRNSHVIAPKFDRARFSKKDLDGKSINLYFGKLGVDKASVFKGFCQNHDSKIFLSIDNDGINTQKDVFLQIYRTAQKFLFSNSVVNESELKVMNCEYYSNSEFDKSLPINLKNIIELCEDLLIDFPELDTPIEVRNSETLHIKPYSENVSLDIDILYKRVDTIFPVALQNCFNLNVNGEYSKSLVIIMPDEVSTNLIIVSSPDITHEYLKRINSGINLLNFIESIFMQDSDFYLSEDVFDNWSAKKLDTIVNDFYFYNERRFLEEYDLSIFDEIRRGICMSLPESERVVELKKIYDIPNRETIEIRNNKLMLDSIRDRQKKILYTGNKNGACYPIGSLRVF